ncbi:hypothetical protein B0H14DRAFT_2561041 [Mycena olivaceomarginata]|nr:hypothetical protein B0H14DRAFT_2561041 [Mycena olivaceomarginata]
MDKRLDKWVKDPTVEAVVTHEKLSVANEAWLDNDVNHVEEDAVIYKLENSSDYEHALSRLDEKEADVIERLKGFAEGLGKKIEKVAGTALVDVPEEQIPEDATDKEIVEAVQKMWADREDGEINGGDRWPQ